MNYTDLKVLIISLLISSYSQLHAVERLSCLSFQNGILNGYTQKGSCNGKGVFWWDSGEFYFGTIHA